MNPENFNQLLYKSLAIWSKMQLEIINGEIKQIEAIYQDKRYGKSLKQQLKTILSDLYRQRGKYESKAEHYGAYNSDAQRAIRFIGWREKRSTK